MKRKAFTLFEIMIVVMIIGIVYSLVLSNFNTKKKVRIYKIPQLKEVLLPYWKRGKSVDFYLYDTCKKSALFINDTYQEKIELEIEPSEFDKVEVYKIDERAEAQKEKFIPIMIDKKLKKVCFHFHIAPNGSSSSYIVKKDSIHYIFYPYFQDVNSTSELGEAVDLLTQKAYKGVSQDEILH